MSVLVHAEVDGDRLDDDEILHESLLILVGGDETTRHVISGGMEQLLLHPDQRTLLQDDPAQDPGRGRGDAALGVARSRTCAAPSPHDVEFMGQRLRAGQKCMLLYESANRDEAKFADPERFDVERQPERARRVRLRRALLPRPGARPPRARGHVRAAPRPAPRPRARRRSRDAAPPPRELHQRPRVDAGAVHANPRIGRTRLGLRTKLRGCGSGLVAGVDRVEWASRRRRVDAGRRARASAPCVRRVR